MRFESLFFQIHELDKFHLIDNRKIHIKPLTVIYTLNFRYRRLYANLGNHWCCGRNHSHDYDFLRHRVLSTFDISEKEESQM